MKQETQFSLFQALSTKQPPTLITLAEVYRLVTTDATLKENTEKYRYFKAQGFTKEADEIKRMRCPAFTPAAIFDRYRRYGSIVSITQYSMVDIDGLTENEAVRLMKRLEEDQIRKHFRIPQPGEAYEIYSVADVLGVINLELKTPLSATKVGMLLNKMGFMKVRSKKARGYMMYRYTLEEISSNRKGTVNDAIEQNLPF